MKCNCRLAAFVAVAALIAAGAWAAAYGFGAHAVQPQPLAAKAIDIDMTTLTQAATPAAPAGGGHDHMHMAMGGAGQGAGPGDILGKLATADVAAGQKYAKVCGTCHTFNKGEPAKVGPNLYGVLGGPHAHMAGFAYSEGMKAMAAQGGKWDYAELNDFLFKPSAHVPGTKMTFAGIKNDTDRANVIAWLRTLADQPEPLPPAQ